MSDILSQSEIEALLNSLSTEGAAGAGANDATSNLRNVGSFEELDSKLGAKANSKSAITYELYDFRRPDKFSREQLRTLQMLHETFARLAATSLSAYLRTPVSIDLISLEQVPYEEYLRSINTSVFTVMSLPPLSGQAVMEMEFQLIFSMIDRLLGGPGRGINRNNLTDIEKPLVRQMVERMFSALKTSWEGIVIVNPGIEAMETSSQFVQIAPPTDIVVTILFEVKVGQSRGAMSMCIPYLVLKPITAKLSAQKWFVNTSRKTNQHSRRNMALQLTNAVVDCSIVLGKCRLQVEDFMKIRPGDTLLLEQKREEPLVMLVANTPKYEVKPGLKKKKLVFSVVNSIDPS
ncbi:MAG: flagellar motor switch protein FliM [Armatimonadetes bacterium]|nr:flagellar motor switch protein FliM [Armatimonadota bacterium]